MRLFEKKWFLAIMILVPNVLIALLQHGAVPGVSPIFILGAALGAATVVFLFFLVVQTLLVRSDVRKIKKKHFPPIALAAAYAIYYLIMLL